MAALARGTTCGRARQPIASIAELTLVGTMSLHATGLAQVPHAIETSVAGAAGTTQLMASIGTARYVAEERLPGGTMFNRDEGDLPQWALGIAHARQDWTWSLSLRQAAGTLDYRGRIQLGCGVRCGAVAPHFGGDCQVDAPHRGLESSTVSLVRGK